MRKQNLIIGAVIIILLSAGVMFGADFSHKTKISSPKCKKTCQQKGQGKQDAPASSFFIFDSYPAVL
jgi:hypothetical protein